MTQYNLEKYKETEKQKEFETNFLKNADEYEVWDEVEIGEEYEAERKFKVEEEDLISYAKGVMSKDPLMTNKSEAKNSIYEGIIPHPLFLTPIAFWCIGKGYRGSWVRSPGAMNPGQKFERYDRIKPGEVISLKMKAFDKWVKRGLHYLTYEMKFYNQEEELKARWWATLILPETREDLIRYQQAEENSETEE